MEIAKILYCFLIMSVLAHVLLSCKTPKVLSLEQKRAITSSIVDTSLDFQRVLLKDYTLCSCLRNAYKDDSAINSDVSLSFYHEMSLYGESVHRFMDSLTKQFAGEIIFSKYPDYMGKRAVIYSCIDLYKSPYLDSLVKSFDKDLAHY